jgi:hypothetical protein
MPSLEPPIAHASSVEDVELTDEDEEVDITDTDPSNPASIPDDGSIVGKDVKLDPELDLMKSSNLIKVINNLKTLLTESYSTFPMSNFNVQYNLRRFLYIFIFFSKCSLGSSSANERRGRSA